jgi:hypothetical protein
MGDVRRRGGSTRLALSALVAFGSAVFSPALNALPVAASSPISVYVGYADTLRADAQNFPTPWNGSPNTTFEGCAPDSSCTFDGGAVRVVNDSPAAVTVDAIAVHLDTCTYTGWPAAVLQPGADLIVTQLSSGEAAGCTGPTPALFDTSDLGPGGASYAGNCVPDGLQPTVDITVDGRTSSYTDSGQVLNTGGIDAGVCRGNESTQWTLIGSKPCPGSLLTLAPPSQQRPVLTQATVTATFSNSCGQPLSDTAVAFAVTAGPNAGLTGSGVTDQAGRASFTYSSAHLGTDTLQASVTNVIGRILSNQVTVSWTIEFAGGGGAFVIGDLENVAGAHVLWWGAQWWKVDRLSRGLAPASFKGFESGNLAPACGQTWTTRPGNSPHPPARVPALMAVIVTDHVVKTGSTITGDVLHIVLVRTDPGYGPNPGHAGRGTIVSQLC